MKRRNVLKTMTLGAILPSVFSFNQSKAANTDKGLNLPKQKILMKAGCQSGGTTVENLEFKARHGIFNIDGGMPKFVEGK